ncbi:TonB-dependent receptor [Hyphomicrobium sp. GJ21]|uniref:TonB-dependent receptor n=1 Tax=Hyphomicrobium sp. GJ21 TaxID=113574 RepID=UPI000622BEC3|nr:TonB-dependent receptor [Hyphomicrobium sp. GJ21]CEJ87194.1 TonB-dependent receptor [Hyphomicrobium sp. GJ21]
MRSKNVCASACIALAMTSAGSLHAQEAGATNQGASEVTLPPVVVAAPKQRIAQKPKTKPKGTDTAQSGSTSGQAEDVDADGVGTDGGLSGNGLPGTAGVFTLGQIDMVGGSAITNDAMWTFSKSTLDQALALAPGVAASNSGGSRNEQLIFVRGFDRWQVPLSIDGITIYRPADNRIDFSSFLTADISEVQIAKGYTSVLNGPGGMGGAINLVTKKPTKAVEGEVQGGMMFGTDGQYEGYKTYASLGTRQRGYYAQVSGALLDTDGWFMSNDFKPTPVENGGERDHSYKDNWQISAKLGLTPNATDDYSINFVRMNNAKGAPYHVTDPVAQQRYWDWPDTTQQNLYWLSHTKLGSASFVETKAYYTTFQDNLVSYDNPAQTTQSLPKAFISNYDDWAGGGSILFGTDVTPWDTFKATFLYRRDQHDETQAYNIRNVSCGSTKPCFREPTQTDLEDTYSIAFENTVHATNRLDIVAGVSYDWRKLYKAEEFTAPSTAPTPSNPGTFFEYNKKDSDAFNWQSAIVYRSDDFNTWHASVSDRTRFPTIFERFSSRFGGATSNPGLEPERSINYEVGWTSAFARNSQMSAAVFYSDVTNLIQSVPFIYQGNAVSQSQNVGDGHYYGIEYSIDYAVNDKLLIGGNITWLQRDIHNPSNAAFELTGMPTVKGISYLTYKITDAWSITPNVEFASDRWTVNSAGTLYYKTGAFALANFQTEYDLTDKTSLMFTARNILDENYVLTDGYPEMGRSFYANMRTQF